jgi:uncharacterized protein YcbK (DUF882 family)
MKIKAAILTLLTCLAVLGPAPAAAHEQRFFHSGDGRIRLVSEKNGRTFEGAYWRAGQGYDEVAIKAIHEVFGAAHDAAFPRVSLRLIAFLDYLEDRLQPGALVTVTSGYRSPEYNTRVRDRGGLAAKASLHQYGMAADIVMAGVSSERIWQTVRDLGFGGAGYYHGRTVHVDVGPARSWDETTSGVGTGLSDDNKLIGMVTGYDIYRAGETATLRFIRMTAFPIGVSPGFSLVRCSGDGDVAEALVFRPTFGVVVSDDCPQFQDIEQMAGLHWELPPDLPPGRYCVRARFCGGPQEGMPVEVSTPAFQVIE